MFINTNFSFYFSALCLAEEDKTDEKTETEPPTVDEDVGKSRDGSKTDDEAVQREEEAIKLDGLNVAQMKELREKAEKFAFQAEVSRMMKLIINSLYRNKEVRQWYSLQILNSWKFAGKISYSISVHVFLRVAV